MGFTDINFKKWIQALENKRGAEMVEAAISLPLIILTAMLLVRMFIFYLEILNTGVAEHMEALDKWDSYSGIGFQEYKDTRDVKLLRGGVLLFDVKKQINTRAYLINEDLIVRASDTFK
ncbi:MAG: hypothetical protein IKE52_00365 [Mogibacterium sp.]|nr:hypothetical protein [Mogibacterium sp.]